jgi:2-hydroxy-3-keto-5-methylthiopentenyl-1-phosphate phosphatase
MMDKHKTIFVSDFDGTIVSHDIAEKILCDVKGNELMQELSYKINNGIIDITYFMNEVCECISQNSDNFEKYIDNIIKKYDVKFDNSFTPIPI